MDKNQSFSAVSLSGGKDSTFMLLRMVELNMPIDAVLFADTGICKNWTTIFSGNVASILQRSAIPRGLNT